MVGKAKQPIKKSPKDLNRYLKHGTQMANENMKRCSTTYAVKKMKIKTTVRYHYLSIRMAKIWNAYNIKC